LKASPQLNRWGRVSERRAVPRSPLAGLVNLLILDFLATDQVTKLLSLADLLSEA
jgi:hypothetical protein